MPESDFKELLNKLKKVKMNIMIEKKDLSALDQEQWSELLILAGETKSQSLMLISNIINVFSDESFFIQALKNNQTVKRIHLNNNSLASVGASALAKFLESDKSLERLEISADWIGDPSAKNFAQSLKENNTLKSLRFFGTNIGSDGAIDLAEALKTNVSLEHFILGIGNSIGDKGIEAIAQMLKENRTLTYLNFCQNNISDEGAMALISALEVNTKIQQIALIGNNISRKNLTKIQSLTKRNVIIDQKSAQIENLYNNVKTQMQNAVDDIEIENDMVSNISTDLTEMITAFLPNAENSDHDDRVRAMIHYILEQGDNSDKINLFQIFGKKFMREHSENLFKYYEIDTEFYKGIDALAFPPSQVVIFFRNIPRALSNSFTKIKEILRNNTPKASRSVARPIASDSHAINDNSNSSSSFVSSRSSLASSASNESNESKKKDPKNF